METAVADLGCHGGINSLGGCANLLFCKMCAENCMNMKEFGPGGGARPWHPLWIRHWNSLEIIKDTLRCMSHGYKIYLCTEVTFNLFLPGGSAPRLKSQIQLIIHNLHLLPGNSLNSNIV